MKILGGIADTVAQSLTAIRQRAVRRPGGPDESDLVAIEIHELDKKNPWPAHELIPASKNLPPPFDFERLTRFMAYGFMMSPVQFHWFSFLSRSFPITKQSGTVPALKRVALDQLMFAPIGIRFTSTLTANANHNSGLACFFTFMTVAEGGGRRAVARKFQDVYLPALKANFMLWPAVQILNFRVIPLQFQIVSYIEYLVKRFTKNHSQPFVSTVGIAWTAYLSLTNSSDEA